MRQRSFIVVVLIGLFLRTVPIIAQILRARNIFIEKLYPKNEIIFHFADVNESSENGSTGYYRCLICEGYRSQYVF